MTIGTNPVAASLGPLELEWVSLFIVAGIALAGGLSIWRARPLGLSVGNGYGLALRAVIWGLVGGRLFHIVDNWDFYSSVPLKVFAIGTGGISLWGAILVGSLGLAFSARKQRLPLRKLADVAALPALAGQALGRVGDALVGERLADVSSLPWSVTYLHPDSVSYSVEAASRHPVALYELVWDVAVLGVLWRWRGRLHHDGALFVAYLAAYAAGRFVISFMRLDPVWFLGFQQAQVLSLAVLSTALWVAWRWRGQAAGA